MNSFVSGPSWSPTPKHDNLTKADRGALQSLKKKRQYIIKPAVKGSAVVVMDREHYISEAERQLNDSNFFTQLDHDPTLEYAKQVSDVVGEMLTEGLISEKNFNYLLVDQPKAGRFYLLPKIHKAGNPGRPIVSANGHPRKRSRSLWICICNPMSKIYRPTYRILQIF